MKKILLLFFGLSTLIVNAQNIADGLIAHFPLDNDYADASGNGYTGTAIGAPEFVEGIKSTGVLFHGSTTGTVDAILTNLQFAPSNSFSISLWFKLTQFESQKFGNVLIGDRGESNGGFQIRQYANSDDFADINSAGGGWLCFTTRGISSDKDFDPRNGVESTEIKWETDMPYMEAVYPGEFIHLVMVVDIENSKKQVWLNNELVVDANTTTLTGFEPAPEGNPIMIGARNDASLTQTPEASFYGVIDEVRIYSKALSSDDIDAINADVGTSVYNISDHSNAMKISQLNESITLNIDLQNSTQVRTKFYDMSGRMVNESDNPGRQGSNSFQYNIENMTKGVYIMNITYSGKSESKRIILK